MNITHIGSVATLALATMASTGIVQAGEASRGSPPRSASTPAGEQKTALFGLFGCGSNCGFGCGCGYRSCNPCGSYGNCYPRPAYGGCGPAYGGYGYYGAPVMNAPACGMPAYGGVGYGVPGYGVPSYGSPVYGAPVYGPYGSRPRTPSIPVVNRPGNYRSTAFEEDQNSPFYP